SPQDRRFARLTPSAPRTTYRCLPRTPSEPQVRTEASSYEEISPHSSVTRIQSLRLDKAIQSQSRAPRGSAVAPARHQRPVAPAPAGQSSSSPALPSHSPPSQCVTWHAPGLQNGWCPVYAATCFCCLTACASAAGAPRPRPAPAPAPLTGSTPPRPAPPPGGVGRSPSPT